LLIRGTFRSTWNSALLAVAMILAATVGCHAKELPHYVFVLPDAYTGWIQVIFEYPASPPVKVVDGNAVLTISDSGVFRLPIYQQSTMGAHDEFFYEHRASDGKVVRAKVPSNYVCTERSGMDNCYDSDEQLSDAYSVGRAGKPHDGTPGSSWWLFVGPPDLRKRMAKPIRRNPDPKFPYQIDSPDDDPTPGRIK
jgi:hypothetical protein